jgi:hypothetical protein
MSAEASQHSSMAEALSSFLPLLAATPEPDLPSLLPSLAKLRSVLLLSLKVPQLRKYNFQLNNYNFHNFHTETKRFDKMQGKKSVTVIATSYACLS